MDKNDIMRRVKFIHHHNRRILLYDFSKVDEIADAMQLIAYAREVIARMPQNSVYTLTDITDSHYNQEVTHALKELSKHNKPFVVAGAAVGVGALQKIVFRAILAFSGRTNIKLFDDRESALDWLAAI